MANTQKHLGKFVDIRTDFGMKFYFGREENKGLLIAFLNSLFEGEKFIEDLRYMPVEQDEEIADARRVIFDLYCISSKGEHFIVEMQQLSQDYFKDRTVYYTSRLLSKQLTRGKKGNDYRLPAVYFIGILEFRLGGDQRRVVSRPTERPYFYDVALCDRHTHELFYDKLGYKLLVLPDFHKQKDELYTLMDQWLHLIKYLHTWDEFPKYLDKRVFGLIFDIGKIGKLTKEELMSYEASLKHKRDAESVFNSARRSGLVQGREEGREEGLKEGEARKSYEIVGKLLSSGRFTAAEIADFASVSVDFVEQVRHSLSTEK